MNGEIHYPGIWDGDNATSGSKRPGVSVKADGDWVNCIGPRLLFDLRSTNIRYEAVVIYSA